MKFKLTTLRSKLIKVAKEILQYKYPTAEVLFLAGSIVKGEGTPHSDLDLGVTPPAAEKEDSMTATITAIVVKPVNPDREWEWPTTLEMSVTPDRRKDSDAALAIFRTISFE